MYYLSFTRMNETPEAVKLRLRELTFGRESDSPMFSWTFNDGSCWAAILSTTSTTQDNPDSIVAWACLTREVDDLPVVGVYVEKSSRRKGLATSVASYLLQSLFLPKSTAVYAVAENWPAWPDVLEKYGLEYFEWE